MILIRNILFLFILSLIDCSIHIHNTQDSPSVEYYDCIYYESMLYCRRPKEPIPLKRDVELWNCSQNGILHSFESLSSNGTAVNMILLEWKSGVDKAEEYLHYRNQEIQSNGSEKYLCECNNPRSFGMNCEYLLPTGTTFADAAAEKFVVNSTMRKYGGDIVCYETLKCNSGLLCLDWRDICDGAQQCMSGFDEENCDKLEFNECENDEYRCMNGMCIPDEFFLDGDYDCMDMSDEKERFIDSNCTFEPASFNCDERMCPPDQWSCGDGQCILDRYAFRYKSSTDLSCVNRRDQFFICEANFREKLWTSPNGQCFIEKEYEELNIKNLSIDDYCTYLLKCWLSRGAEKNCPCRNDNACGKLINSNCSSVSEIRYPKGGLVAPYVFERRNYTYNPPRSSQVVTLNGTIKCRGYIANFSFISKDMNLFIKTIQKDICNRMLNSTRFSSEAHHQACYQDSKTFTNRSYNFTDVCKSSGECISSYRIKDGIKDCWSGSDENQTNELIIKTCSNVRRHRFRCSIDQPTCLYANKLGDFNSSCKNNHDESWMGSKTMLSRIYCNNQIKDGCSDLRLYIDASWKSNADNDSNLQHISFKQFPFRSYCDTFWDFSSKEDENKAMCQSFWVCAQDQWQCYTGQCIHYDWVLDGEWDCPDASDEENIFAVNFNTLHHNYKWLRSSDFKNNFTKKYYLQQPFGKSCNLTIEYPCLPINMSYFSNDSRPCIDLKLIGNGHADCSGGYDERSAMNYCDSVTTLGYNFKCLSSNTCIDYSRICTLNGRCPNISDDDIWCRIYNTSNQNRQSSNFRCMNDTTITNGRCDGKYDCFNGEDEYMCPSNKSTSTVYRKQKELVSRTIQQKLQLPQFPIATNTTTTFQSGFIVLSNTILQHPIVPYWCNRGIGTFTSNGSIVCFCPPQYHGDQCQYHSDRITVVFHLNLTQSTYATSTDKTTVIKLLVLFLSHNQVLGTEEFHVRPATETDAPKKKRAYFHYSRSTQSLETKKNRYFDRSNVITQHPYSIRIEAYEMKKDEKSARFAVWQYPIYFDYLPVYRFAKVLRLAELDGNNLCNLKPCNENQDCYPLMNEQSQRICLCKNNFFGPNCSNVDSNCMNNYCSSDALCQPSYRSSLNSAESPYCICPLDHIGHRCKLTGITCSSNPCKNEGACYQVTKLDDYYCECSVEYEGKTCEVKKPTVKLYINQNNTIKYDGIVIQYFKIHFSTFRLDLVNQSVYSKLPDFLFYLHRDKIAPEIILLKKYVQEQAEIYLISLHLNASSINANTSISEKNHCKHVHSLFPTDKDISIFQYHQLCKRDQNLLCFYDEDYVCICDEGHNRTECFSYDHTHDHCSNCHANGHCLKGETNEYLCICPLCHVGNSCEFHFESFSLTLDQLFYNDLLSENNIIKQMTYYFLIITPCILLLIGLVNNIFCYITFRRPKCLRNGIGQYLFYMSIVNQINLIVLVIRFVHLTVNIANPYSHVLLDNIICKLSSYFLTSSTRIIYWLGSLIAIERIYVTLFLNGRWLKKPRIARCLILVTIISNLIVTGYELHFIQSQVSSKDGTHSMCVLNFPVKYSYWKEHHKIVSIINALIPFLINLFCTIGIIYIVTKKKMNVNVRSALSPLAVIMPTNEQEEVDTSKISTIKFKTPKVDVNISEIQLSPLNTQNRFRLLIDVLTENKELVVAPAITLIPQLFSLPFFIASFLLGCQDLRGNNLRYLLIVSYFTTFIPQLISFFLYISPSSFYSREWHATNIGKWIKTYKLRYYPTALPTKISTIDGTTR